MKVMEEVKKCFKCGKDQPLSKFYVHKRMSDGHLNKCKQCVKDYVTKRENELRKNEEWVKRERERGREKYYRLGYNKNHPSTDRKRETIKKYRQKFPEKYLASKYTEIFLTKRNGFNLHHWSYNQEDWLDIIELSVVDHNFIHRHLVYDQEKMIYKDLDENLLNTKDAHIRYITQILENRKTQIKNI